MKCSKTSIKGYIKRFVMLTAGLLIAAYGICMTVNSQLGISPWDVFAQGLAFKLSAITGSTYTLGTLTRWIGWVVLVLAVVLREKIGFGTIYDILIVGSFINFYTGNGLVPSPESFALRFILLIAGFVLWSFGVYFYLAAELGAGPRDSLMAALAKRNIPVNIAKNAIEAVVFVIGWLCGGTVGIGTVIAVFIMGYLLKFWFAVFRFDLAKAENESLIDTAKNVKKLFVKA
ncbi:MAG: hypothetical protein IKA10_08155 [Oscillospiraceae bacterium]|nr:hypothetical protein [Oscillospiraceae bacterium]